MANFRIRNASNTGWIDGATASGLRVRNQANSGWVDKSGNLTGLSVRNQANSGWITFGGAGVSYSITPNATGVNPGASVTFTVSTVGFGSGTLYWTNAGTTAAGDFTDSANSGSVAVTGNSGSITRTLAAGVAGGKTITLQLRTGSTSGPVVATASAVTVNTVAPPETPVQLSLYYNDLDAYYLPGITSPNNGAYNDLRCTVDSSEFFSKGGDHLVFALDLTGGQGSNNPHCGPIVRRGQNMWGLARGFIIHGNGRVSAEYWNGTWSPGLAENLPNTANGTFNPASTPVFSVRVRAGYRDGPYANRMLIGIYAGTSIYGAMLFEAQVPWGWDWTGQHHAAIGGIAMGFVAPVLTGCVEQLVPRSAPNAVAPISNFQLLIQQ
ncbi:hypothetical protein [Alicycliphilus denitrificans]|jgi:hypothetical protein|uniref:Uncharacterized protein n=1 Tax=Alicycliphilus denitrificans TaxID=179636 RepID=A0A3R7EDP5_9BURK|nr:hypothetical protein [Alicycliphilus denitrificans]RKJ96621.1 hypothetical protein CE154_011400 [Alicycliphilus denitrificans]